MQGSFLLTSTLPLDLGLTLSNTEFFDPLKGLEGYLCPGIKISGMIYIVDTPFGISNLGLFKIPEKISMHFTNNCINAYDTMTT